MEKRKLVHAMMVVSVTTLLGCSSDPPSTVLTPYSSDAGATGVVGDGSARVYAGEGCIDVGGECVKPKDKCAAGDRVDIIVDSSGKPITTVCYKTSADVPIVETTSGVALEKENKGVVRLDGTADGVDVAGDVTSSGNNVTVFGQGPEVSVIGGDVTSSGNNFSLRGATVQKDVTVAGNNATLVFCVIEGDVEITGNNAVLAECTIHGKLKITGQNTTLVNVRVAGDVTVEGDNTRCDAVTSFTDANADKIVAPAELGSTIACSDK